MEGVTVRDEEMKKEKEKKVTIASCCVPKPD
jgi:hypothetical protein